MYVNRKPKKPKYPYVAVEVIPEPGEYNRSFQRRSFHDKPHWKSEYKPASPRTEDSGYPRILLPDLKKGEDEKAADYLRRYLAVCLDGTYIGDPAFLKRLLIPAEKTRAWGYSEGESKERADKMAANYARARDRYCLPGYRAH